MKQLLAMLLTITTTVGGPDAGQVDEESRAPSAHETAVRLIDTGSTRDFLSELRTNKPGLLEREVLRTQRLRANAVAMDRAVDKLRTHVNKTWYVFSGSTPSGWDCSGLVRWTYEQVGLELEHSATKQAHAGRIVKHPLPGDIVAYQYGKGYYFHHVGIYVGDGMTIQALRNTTRTMLVPVDSPVVGFSDFVFVRVLERDASTPGDWAAERLPAN